MGLLCALCLLALPGLRSAGDVYRLPGILRDTDKYSKDQGNAAFVWAHMGEGPAGPIWIKVPSRSALSIPQDANDNMTLDPGEDWSETIDGVEGEWSIWHDKSCWAASANNLYRYATGYEGYHRWMYTEGVPTVLSGGGRSYWFSSGDFPSECLSYEDVAWIDEWPDDFSIDSWWLEPPISWVRDQLRRGVPIAASVDWHSLTARHAFTIYGIDTLEQKLWVVDSDSDRNGDKPYWRRYRWSEAYILGGYFQIEWSEDNTWYDIGIMDSLKTRVWAKVSGGNIAGNYWFNTPSGTKVHEISSLDQHRPCTVRVVDGGRRLDCLIVGFKNHIYSPTTLLVEPAGELRTHRFVMRDTTLDIAGLFSNYDQQALEGTVYLRPGGTWYAPSTTIIGSQSDALVEQTGGDARLWSVILGHEPLVKGTYWLLGGTLKYTEMAIGEEGRGELGVASGGTVVINEEGNRDGDNDLGLLVLGRLPGSRGTVYVQAGGSLESRSLSIGRQGVGIFDQQGGTVVVPQVFLGHEAWLAEPPTGGSPPVLAWGDGSYTLKGNGLLQTEKTVVGSHGYGAFTQSGGTHEADELVLGDGAIDFGGVINRSNGQYLLSGGLLQADDLTVGLVGRGRYDQSGGRAEFGQVSLRNGLDDMGVAVSGGELVVAGDFSMRAPNVLTISGTGSIQAASAQLRGTISHGEEGQLAVGNLAIGDSVLDTSYALNQAGTISVAGNETVGERGKVTVNQHGGQHTVGGVLTVDGVGTEVGNRASYSLRDGLLRAAQAVVGLERNGYLEQSDEGRAEFTQSLVLGGGAGGRGEYVLTGGELAAQETILGPVGEGHFRQYGGLHAVAGALTLSGGASTYLLEDGELQAGLGVLGMGSAGTFEQNGGRAEFSQSLTLGEGPGTGNYSLSSGSLETGTTVVGNTGIGVFSQSGGLHRVDDFLYLAGGQDGFGTYTISGGVLDVGTGTISLVPGEDSLSGSLTVTGGTVIADTIDLNGRGSLIAVNGQATLRVNEMDMNGITDHDLDLGAFQVGHSGRSTGVTLRLGQWQHVEAGEITIGHSLKNQVTSVLGERSFTFGTEALYLGYGDDTIGQLSIATAGSGVTASNQYVGYMGEGTVTQSSGVNIIMDMFSLGFLAGSAGYYNLSGGEVYARGDEVIGFLGEGVVSQSGGTHVVLGELGIGIGATANGRYTLDGGTLNTRSVQIADNGGTGRLVYNGGNLFPSMLQVNAGGWLNLNQDWALNATRELRIAGGNVVAATDRCLELRDSAKISLSDGNLVADELLVGGAPVARAVASFVQTGGLSTPISVWWWGLPAPMRANTPWPTARSRGSRWSWARRRRVRCATWAERSLSPSLSPWGRWLAATAPTSSPGGRSGLRI